MEHHQMITPQQQSRPPRGHGGHHRSGGHHHGHHGHHKSHGHDPSRHRSRRAMSRQPERSGYHYHQPMIPRSHSYSGQAGLQESLARMGQGVPPMLARHQSPHVGRRPPPRPTMNYYSNYHPHQGFVVQEEDNDACSTCSSSSSDSDDPYAYQLPTRKAYGGVRLSYVPNDRIRAGRHHQRSMQNGNSEYVSQRHSLRGASLQPASLPPRQQQQQQQQHNHHQHPHQQQQQQQLQQQQHQQQFQSSPHPHQHFAHPGPAS